MCDDVHKWNDLVHQLVGAHRLYTWSGCYLVSNRFVIKTIILFKFSDNLSIEQLCVVVGHLECLQIGLLQVYNQNNHIFNYYDYLSCIQILFLVTTCSSMVWWWWSDEINCNPKFDTILFYDFKGLGPIAKLKTKGKGASVIWVKLSLAEQGYTVIQLFLEEFTASNAKMLSFISGWFGIAMVRGIAAYIYHALAEVC